MVNTAFEGKDTQVLGISTDARPTQTAFAASLGGVPYPVLGDFQPKGQVAQLYGIYNEQRGTSDRAVIIIDKEGIVRFSQTYAGVGDISTDDLLAEIDKL